MSLGNERNIERGRVPPFLIAKKLAKVLLEFIIRKTGWEKNKREILKNIDALLKKTNETIDRFPKLFQSNGKEQPKDIRLDEIPKISKELNSLAESILSIIRRVASTLRLSLVDPNLIKEMDNAYYELKGAISLWASRDLGSLMLMYDNPQKAIDDFGKDLSRIKKAAERLKKIIEQIK
jgi:archaellum component FlaC